MSHAQRLNAVDAEQSTPLSCRRTDVASRGNFVGKAVDVQKQFAEILDHVGRTKLRSKIRRLDLDRDEKDVRSDAMVMLMLGIFRVAWFCVFGVCEIVLIQLPGR